MGHRGHADRQAARSISTRSPRLTSTSTVCEDWKKSVRGLRNARPTDRARHGHDGVRRKTMMGHVATTTKALR